MQNTPPQWQGLDGANSANLSFVPPAPRRAFQSEIPKISTHDLEMWLEDWLLVAEQSRQTARTREVKRDYVSKLIWFLKHRGFADCGVPELRRFFQYLSNGHEEPGGRWGNPSQTRPMRPVTAASYYAYLKGYFTWLVGEGVIPASPFVRIKGPEVDDDQIQPFTSEQVQALFRAARAGKCPERDTAILRLMISTGIRASELCGLQRKNINLEEGYVRIFGKRQKYRTVPFGYKTKRAIWRYIAVYPRTEDHYMFVSDNGPRGGEPLTRSGLLQIFERLGERAGLQSVRCSPHTMRHTFAVLYLDGGGNALDLMRLLGHTKLTMTSRYVALTNTRIAQQRKLDPGDKLSD